MIVSVIKQLESGDRFVIVDAGSTDNTHAVIDRYRDHITHVEINEALNQAAAIRWGFDNFEADLGAYLNTDDFLLPGAIATARRALTGRNLDAVYSHRVFVDEASRVQSIWHLPRHRDFLMKRWDYIPQETCFWTTAAMNKAGGIDPSFDFAVDYDFFCRLMDSGRFERLNTYLACFRVHGASKTSMFNKTTGAREVQAIQTANQLSTRGLWRIAGRLLRTRVEQASESNLTSLLKCELQESVQLALSVPN